MLFLPLVTFAVFCTVHISGDEISFMGSSHSITEWKEIQTQFNRLMEKGRWINAKSEKHSDIAYYNKVCIQEGPYFERYHIGGSIYGACFHDLANIGK